MRILIHAEEQLRTCFIGHEVGHYHQVGLEVLKKGTQKIGRMTGLQGIGRPYQLSFQLVKSLVFGTHNEQTFGFWLPYTTYLIHKP